MLTGKKGIIYGVANERSIAWAIAQTLHRHGARLSLAYLPRMEKNVRELTEPMKPLLIPCDLSEDLQIHHVYDVIREEFGGLDFIIHSVAFAHRDDFKGKFYETPRSDFCLAHDLSAYSLTAVVAPAVPLLKEGASIVTMTYLGGERAVPGYNVMGVAKAALESSVRYLACDLGERGIRVNAISAGPIRTLAARGIAGFDRMQRHHAQTAPLRRNTEVSEIADVALFLVSDLSRGVTAEIIHVDAGYHAMGM
jgi:enoyl-[acyl-carrier protein] reductase I